MSYRWSSKDLWRCHLQFIKKNAHISWKLGSKPLWSTIGHRFRGGRVTQPAAHKISHCIVALSSFRCKLMLLCNPINRSGNSLFTLTVPDVNNQNKSMIQSLQYLHLNTIYHTKPKRMTKGLNFQSCWYLSPQQPKSLRVSHHPLGTKGHTFQPKQNHHCNETRVNIYLYERKTFTYCTGLRDIHDTCIL